MDSDLMVAGEAKGPSRMVMVTEGTYPHSQGGVSVWCDQVIGGIPSVDFEILALTAFGNEPITWQVPPNVRAVHTIGLWGPVEKSIPTDRAESIRALGALRRILEACAVDPRTPGIDVGQAVDELNDAWAVLCEPQISSSLPELVTSDAGMQMILDVWNSARVRGQVARSETISVAHAVTVAENLSHSLRPLGWATPKADLYHAVSNGLATLPCIAAYFRHSTPFIVSEHGVYLRERLLAGANGDLPFPVRALLMGFVRELVSVAYRTASVIAPGNQYNRGWQVRLGADPDRIVTTYNGVDPIGFPTGPPEPEVPTLAFVGRIDPLKDLETLIRAFALVKDDIPDARLRIFGATPKGNEAYRARCTAVGESLDVVEGISWEGRVDDICEAYGSGSVVVLSSISEGFPYTVIEGMCSGRPIVATDVGGVREAVGDAGIVVKPRDPRAFADACIELLLDAGRRSELGGHARQRVLDHFTLDASVAALRGAYADAYSTPRPAVQRDRAVRLPREQRAPRRRLTEAIWR